MRMLSGRRCRSGAAAVVAVAATVVGTGLTSPARADGPTERAAQLSSQVHDLQRKAEAATEAYDAAQGRLAQVITSSSLAEQRAEQAKAAGSRRSAGAETQIRRLYMLGGPDVLYVSLFTQGGVSSAASVEGRLLAARGILRARTGERRRTHSISAPPRTRRRSLPTSSPTGRARWRPMSPPRAMPSGWTWPEPSSCSAPPTPRFSRPPRPTPCNAQRPSGWRSSKQSHRPRRPPRPVPSCAQPRPAPSCAQRRPVQARTCPGRPPEGRACPGRPPEGRTRLG